MREALRNSLIYSIFLVNASASVVVYQNDFDTTPTAGSGVTGGVSGGDQTSGANTGSLTGGVVSVEQYDNYPEFSGDFHRVTMEDDRLIIQVSGLDASTTHTLGFSLAMIDSWDGTSSEYGIDLINVQVHDGGAVASNMVSGGVLLNGFSVAHNSNASGLTGASYVQKTITTNEQLGFNTNPNYWNEDGYVIEFDDLTAASGTLTFEIWASTGTGSTGSGYQGGNDESFAIDNFTVTSNIPEPSVSLLSLLGLGLVVTRRVRFQ